MRPSLPPIETLREAGEGDEDEEQEPEESEGESNLVDQLADDFTSVLPDEQQEEEEADDNDDDKAGFRSVRAADQENSLSEVENLVSPVKRGRAEDLVDVSDSDLRGMRSFGEPDEEEGISEHELNFEDT